jgi:predicted nucleotidyltransferase
LRDKERFGFHSDIDLCVEGIPDNLYFQAAGETLLMTDEFDIDIIPFENLPPDKRELVMKGKILYEKR